MKEQERIAVLLEKYWQAETTVEEERELAAFFSGGDIPVEWADYKQVFSYFADEGQVTPSEDLQHRIMMSIYPRRQRLSWWAAAAVIAGITIGIATLSPTAPAVEDTYDDPQQALAAVQKALFTVSRNLNKGIQPLK